MLPAHAHPFGHFGRRQSGGASGADGGMTFLAVHRGDAGDVMPIAALLLSDLTLQRPQVFARDADLGGDQIEGEGK